MFPNLPTRLLPWIILIISAINVIFLGGKRRAFGSFIAVLKRDYNGNITLAELNWIGDSYAALGYMSTGVSTMLIIHFNRRYAVFQFGGSLLVLMSCLTSSAVPNPHWLFLTHTLLHGIGSALILSVIGLVVSEHFPKQHPYHLLATTLVSGGSVASIVFVTLFAALIQSSGWRLSFVWLGLIYFIVTGSGALVFRKREIDSDTYSTVSSKDNCDCRGQFQFRNIPLLILWFSDRVMTSVVTYGMLLNLTNYVHRFNPSLVSSTVLTTLFAAGEASTYVIAAVITGATKTFFKNRLKYILLTTSILLCVTLILLEFFAQIRIVRRLLCFLAGFFLGPSITFLFPAGEELTRLPGYVAYPFSLGGMGFGMMISPMLTAHVAELFKYNGFFIIQGGIIGLKSICLLSTTILLCFIESDPELGESVENYTQLMAAPNTDNDDTDNNNKILTDEVAADDSKDDSYLTKETTHLLSR